MWSKGVTYLFIIFNFQYAYRWTWKTEHTVTWISVLCKCLITALWILNQICRWSPNEYHTIIPFPFFIPNAVSSSTPWKYMGNGGISICILNLCSRWRWVMYFMPQPLQSLIEGFMGPRHGVNVVAKRHLNPYQWCNPDYLMFNFFFSCTTYTTKIYAYQEPWKY